MNIETLREKIARSYHDEVYEPQSLFASGEAYLCDHGLHQSERNQLLYAFLKASGLKVQISSRRRIG